MENLKEKALPDKQLIKCLATQSYNFHFYQNNMVATNRGPEFAVLFQTIFEKKWSSDAVVQYQRACSTKKILSGFS